MTQWIEKALRELGITPKYRGYRRAVLSISLALEDEDRLLDVIKQIYEVVGEMDGHCKWKTVEGALRYIVAKAWKKKPQRLIEMAGYTLTQAPTSADFLDIISNYIRRTYLAGTNGRDNL